MRLRGNLHRCFTCVTYVQRGAGGRASLTHYSGLLGHAYFMTGALRCIQYTSLCSSDRAADAAAVTGMSTGSYSSYACVLCLYELVILVLVLLAFCLLLQLHNSVESQYYRLVGTEVLGKGRGVFMTPQCFRETAGYLPWKQEVALT